MKPPEYTEEQIADIKEREAKCLAFLKENQMNPSAALFPQNMGNDVFGIRLVPFLQDLKYNLEPSPITKEDLR